MPVIFDETDICVAPNEIFYATANAAQMRGFAVQMHFLDRMERNIWGATC